MLARAVVVFRCVNQERNIAAVVGVDTKPAELSRCCGVDHNVHNIERMERQRREQDTGAEPLDVPHHIGQWITEMSRYQARTFAANNIFILHKFVGSSFNSTVHHQTSCLSLLGKVRSFISPELKLHGRVKQLKLLS